ncbi:MAG: RNA polymerase sigma factor [Bacteroidetes bacterium]|nr:MAG: RNA polymerase sigma factor [Bacteroidota bacterium]
MNKRPKYHVLLMLEGCRKQSRLSQLQLYQHFYSYALGVCLRYSRSRAEAEEILNDGFLKVFRNIHQYRPEQPFKPWLRKILIHTAIDYYRKYHKQALETLPYEDEWTGAIANDALEQLAYQDVIALLQKLPPAYRMVFNLYAVEGMTHAEIAKTLGIKVGTSKSNLAKARMKLKQLMGTHENLTLKPEGNGKK